MKRFVPGRICLFGEHSDWAGGYRRINADIEKGHALICGTTQGIHATVKPHPATFVVTATLADGTRRGLYEAPMRREALLEEAQKGGFFSHAAGVACQVMTHYRVRGLKRGLVGQTYAPGTRQRGRIRAIVCRMLTAFRRQAHANRPAAHSSGLAFAAHAVIRAHRLRR